MKISDLARAYSKRYIKFLIDNGISISSKDAYDMFRYVIHRMYGFRCGSLFPLLVMNFNECTECLEEVKNSITVSDDVDIKSIIDCSCVYTLVAVQYCAGNIRVKEVC